MEENTKITNDGDNIGSTVSITEQNEIQQTSLLEALQKMEKKHLMYQRVTCFFIVILVVSILCVLPSLYKTLSLAQTTLENANVAILDADTAIVQADKTLIEISDMVVNSEAQITDAMAKLNEIDFVGLNQAIEDLGAVVEPLAKFFNTFRR